MRQTSRASRLTASGGNGPNSLPYGKVNSGMETDLKRIVWVASYPKSGNTWVRLFIAALRFRTAGGQGSYDPNTISSQAEFYQDNARYLYEPLFRQGWTSAGKAEMAHARPVVHRMIATNARKSTPVIKTHNAAISVNGVPTITADVTRCSIYIVRHPFDVAVSVRDHFGAPDYDQAIAQMMFPNYVQPRDDRFIDAPVGSWSQNVRSWTGAPDPKVHVFRYEDLLDDTEQAFTRIAGLLGVNDRDAVLRAIADVDFEALKGAESRHGFVETSSHATRFFARGRVGVGHEELTDRQMAVIAKGASEAASLHGYSL